VRVEVKLACAECGSRNYTATKNETKQAERLERRKYCPRCNGHTTHRETR
jgi:large subunit ribosomal protein L33